MRRQVLFIFALFLTSIFCQGATWYVDPSGTDDGSHGTAAGAGAFRTIQYAINSAGAGDVISVAYGAYGEALTINKNLQLSGAGVSNTVINASGLNLPAITISGGNVKIRNFGIKEDNGSARSCIYISGGTLDAGTTADHGNNRFWVQGTGSAIENGQHVDLQAEYNDWGSARGPAISTNPGGDGGSITGVGDHHVIYAPWGGGPVTSVSPVTVCAEAVTVDIPITVSHFTGVGSFSLTLGYTTAQLTTPVILSRNAAFDLPGHVWNPFYFTSNPNGSYKISGFGSLPGDGITLSDGATMMTLRFTIGTIATAATIAFSENAQGTACEFTGIAPDYPPFGDMPTSTNYINGDVTINRLTANTISTAQTICSGSTAALTGNAVTGGAITYQWQSSGTENGSYANVSGGTGQNYTTGVLTADTWFRRIAVSVLNTVSCSSSSASIKITVDQAPEPANAGSDQAQCNNGTFTLAGNAASAGQGTWTVQSGTATITSLHSANSGVTGVLTGTPAILRWTIVNGTCSSFDEVTLTNDAAPDAANAGSDQEQCNNESFTLAGNAASAGQGTWTVQSGTATITSLHSATSGITGVPAGSSAVLRWTIVNGTCSSFDDVSLTNDLSPIAANAGADQAQCGNGNFTMAGNTASVGEGTWTVQNGTANITSLHSATTGVTGVPAGSSAVLRWTITNGTCSSFDDVSLSNDAVPETANAGSDQSQYDNGSFTLAGNPATAGTGTWTVQSGTATITNLHSAISGITGIPVGTMAVLRWTIVNGTCSSFDEVNLTNKSLLNISGNVTYYNLDSTPLLADISIGLFQDGLQVGNDYSITSGSYIFGNLLPGTYEIRAHTDLSDEGGVNSTDAAQLNHWSVYYPFSIEKVRFFAGDVAGGGQYTPVNNVLQSTDAYRIQLHFVDNTEFDRPANWTFWKAGETISFNPEPSSTILFPTIVVQDGEDVTMDLYGLCTGDFNMSFNPDLKNTASSTLHLADGVTRQIGRGQEFDLPLNIEEPSEISAISLILNFPADLVTVKDVLINGTGGQLDWAVKGNELRIGWNSPNPLLLSAMTEMITLKLVTSDAFQSGNRIRISLASSPLNELADGDFKVIDNAVLYVDVFESSEVGMEDLAPRRTLGLTNYPNPFSHTTVLSYSLPYDGLVTLEIRDLLGQLVKTVVNDREETGYHSFKLEDWSLMPGIYTAFLSLQGRTDALHSTIKIINTR